MILQYRLLTIKTATFYKFVTVLVTMRNSPRVGCLAGFWYEVLMRFFVEAVNTFVFFLSTLKKVFLPTYIKRTKYEDLKSQSKRLYRCITEILLKPCDHTNRFRVERKNQRHSLVSANRMRGS